MKTTSTFALCAALFSSFVPLVSAHGIVTQITIDGKVFKGNVNGNSNVPVIKSVIREVSKQDPVKGATNPDVNCGNSAQAAALVADAMPGSEMTFTWKTASLSDWPHNTGPMMNYLASCGNTTCDKFDSTKAKWFKFHQDGRQADGTWVQAQLMTGGTAKAKIPTNIMPGNYLLRHEIIALHLATSKGGAEFYPACIQLRIGGTGTGQPSSSELVAFPGGYSDTDAGIFDPNVFNFGSKYDFPGPPVAAFVGNDAATDANPDDIPKPQATGASSSNSTSSGTSTGTGSGSGSKGQCKLKRRSASGETSYSKRSGNAPLLADKSLPLVKSVHESHRPRRFSRIMRDLVLASRGMMIH
jgi:hypothetical protein